MRCCCRHARVVDLHDVAFLKTRVSRHARWRVVKDASLNCRTFRAHSALSTTGFAASRASSDQSPTFSSRGGGLDMVCETMDMVDGGGLG